MNAKEAADLKVGSLFFDGTNYLAASDLAVSAFSVFSTLAL